MSSDDIKSKVEELAKAQKWNNLYDFNGVMTRSPIKSPGCNTQKWGRLEPVFEKIGLDGKNVLDVGCSEGYYAIKMSEMGASVTGIEPDTDRLDKANFAKEFFGADGVRFEPTSIYDLGEDGQYDIAIALGFIHRIPDIYKALEKLCALADVVILEHKTLNDKRAICKWGGGEVKLNKWNKLYFIPTISFVEGIMADFGFEMVYVDKDKKSHLNYKRTIEMFRRK